jgi:hypothetical protein
VIFTEELTGTLCSYFCGYVCYAFSLMRIHCFLLQLGVLFFLAKLLSLYPCVASESKPKGGMYSNCAVLLCVLLLWMTLIAVTLEMGR